MENINKNLGNNVEEKQQRIQGYIEEFYRITNEYVGREDFQPNATLESNGYEGPNTFFSRMMNEEGMDLCSLVEYNKIHEIALQEGIGDERYKDQLYHSLIGSTRRPFHDPSTDRLYDDISKRKEMLEVFDMKKLLQELAKL